MSRIAKRPIVIPPGISLKLEGDVLTASGPKGQLHMRVTTQVKIDGEVTVSGSSHLAGMTRTSIANMLKGLSDNWTKTLELNGTGYRAQVSGNQLNLALGYSHPVVVTAPPGISFEVKENKITVLGPDRALVGLIAANIRKLRPADPYKHKGFKYQGEVLIKKAGKAAKAGGPTGGK